MKKNLSKITIALSLLISCGAIGQNQQRIYPCVTDEATQDIINHEPAAGERMQRSLQDLRRDMQNEKNAKGKSAAVQYTIPVVFHVLHMGGSENLSANTLTNALKWVNDDFAKANADASLTAAPFSSLYINSDIKFMLAKKDPNGNCTDGIVRHIDPKTQWSKASAYQANYHSYTWDPTRYLNVYVVANIIPDGTVTGGGIIVGYAIFPGSLNPGDARDHITYNANFLNGSQARSLTHEIGHFLSLQHTWGPTNNPGISCGDDGMADTPPTKGNFTGCPSSLTGNTCAGSGGLDNIQNIMNYSDCPINFTTDQTNAMRACANGTTAGRNNLITASNHTFTGINSTVTCAPICDWMSVTNNYTVCSGANLTVKDVSYNGAISGYTWSATGANVLSPNSPQTAISFTQPGTSVVTLTVMNGQGSSTLSRTITVLNGSQTVPNNYFESFEGVGTPTNWTIVNPNNGSVTWEQTNMGASNGSQSFYIDGLSNIANQMDYLVMPIINPQLLQNNTVFTFDYAYARQSTSNNDKFEVQVSTDCGGNWSTLMSMTAANMANGSGGVTATPYVPQTSDWKTVDIYNHPNWTLYTISSSVKIRFMFKEDEGGIGFGNRFYLDNIIFSDPNGTNDLTKSILFRMMPNPTSGEAKLLFTLSNASDVRVEVKDIMGRTVISPVQYKLQPGEQSLSVNNGNVLSKGMYFVNMEVNGAKMSRKLIVD